MKIVNGAWSSAGKLPGKKYICGYCGEDILCNNGFSGSITYKNDDSATKFSENAFLYICHHCHRPTFFFMQTQVPGAAFGKDIEQLPEGELKSLYREARECLKVGAFTASVLCSRKMLMNIAVDKKAKEGLAFTTYVDYLVEKCLPQDSKDWVDHIRDQGNEATHKIAIMTEETAKELITFIEMILTLIYEYPSRVKKT